VAIFAQRLVAGEPVTIYGDGEQTRDYVYVNDVVDAFVRAADRGDGGVRNIGTGHQTSVNELYRTMAQVAGSGAAPEYAPARRGDLKYNALSADLARQELGWEPATGLAEGTRAVIEFVRAQAT
jgi:UDP-glucose 4-epimerase